MEAADDFGDLDIYPARRCQWIVSSLAYHYGLEKGVENEIIVLSTGLDQYLQEIFHNLDVSAKGKISADDFTTLCRVLKLDNTDILSGISSEISFREFHARLCEHFACRSDVPYVPFDCKDNDQEYVHAEVTMRHLQKRNNSLCPQCRISNESKESDNRKWGTQTRGRSGCPDAYSQNATKVIAKQQEEIECLREIIEDLRSSLQSSDARCIALQVALSSLQQTTNNNVPSTPFTTSTAVACAEPRCQHGRLLDEQKVEIRRAFSTSSLSGDVNEKEKKNFSRLARELDNVREWKDQQINEILHMNQELKSELLHCSVHLYDQTERNRFLNEQQANMAAGYEKARNVLRSSLQKVRDLEKEAGQVILLQDKMAELEAELQQLRSKNLLHGSCVSDRESPMGRSNPEIQKEAADDNDGADSDDDFMSRKIEGRSSSDDEVFRGRKMLEHFDRESGPELQEKLYEQITFLTEQLDNTQMEKQELHEELELRTQECDELQTEMTLLETDRVRLSLLEEKLYDVVCLLQQLRRLYLCRRTLGKYVLDVIDSLSRPQNKDEDGIEPLGFVSNLHHKLSTCDLIRYETANPLYIQ